MTALNILVAHRDVEQAKAHFKLVDWSKLDVHLAGFVSTGDAAVNMIRQQKYSILMADIDLLYNGSNFIQEVAPNYPGILFLPIAPLSAVQPLAQLFHLENVSDFVDSALDPQEIFRALTRAQRACKKMMLATAAEQLMDLSAFDVPEALTKNVRSSLRTILKDTIDADLNLLAQDVSILFEETLNPLRFADIDFSKAAAIELISQVRYHLFTQNLNVDEEFSPPQFIQKIQTAYTNEDLEDLCLYYLRLAIRLINPGSSSGQMSSLVRTAIKITRQRYSDPGFTLVSLSDEIGISPNYLSSVFKMETGIRFKKYLNSYRIEQAKLLLGDSRYKIYEVANLVGIEDSRYFSQIFRTYTGLKPSEYRNVCVGNDDAPAME